MQPQPYWSDILFAFPASRQAGRSTENRNLIGGSDWILGAYGMRDAREYVLLLVAALMLPEGRIISQLSEIMLSMNYYYYP